ncbi:kelch repeat and BTB domain-containing protein 13-like isoform X1 [Eublepharis macularius]|uniref:Kelch repeat and BTB domain-containing protein 13-like isoform X1 n=1 Tax=Eublepharis macularius TaxID=481883 RepID=A0AA97L8U7_EUBMA|nr:kelch repeat and BTB domain-containing protein 13-like isoform X1 [Eublepharis macularius]
MPRLAMPCRGLRAASLRGLSVASAWLAWGPLVTRGLGCLCRALCSLCALVLYPWKRPGDASVLLPEPWEGCPERRIYRGGDAEAELLTVYTKPCSFQVDLAWLAAESAYFKALSRSRMQEAAGGQLHLDHVPSGAFHAILQWVFLGRFSLAEEELLPAVQAASYLLLPRFLDRCWEALRPLLGPQNCFSYLHFAEAVGCPELRAEVCRYLSAHLLELARPVTHQLAPQMKEELARLRLDGPPRLCVLQKENVSGAPLPPLRGLYCRPLPPEEGDWHCATHLPFQAEKWSFSTAQLLNYLFIMGGYREKRGARGFIFRMAAFRYNPLTDVWHPTAPPKKRRRHFSTAVVGHHIYAIGGWYLDSLLAPDSSTCLYTAVERYDPWTDSWAFVSSLPMGDFSFTISLSHDLPLCTAHAGSIYTLGTVQRTGEKLLLCYDVATDTWQELLPTLTRADADLPGLYFLGGTEPLFVVGSSSRDNVVTSFSVASHQWGPVRSLPKCSLAGQGLVWEGLLYMASPDLGAILQADLSRPACWLLLPPPPFPLCYEALFLLHFPQAATTGERAAEQGEEDPQR